MTRVLFVCLGNICRSPMAEAVFRNLVKESDLDSHIEVDSAGTSDWHLGKTPHKGTRETLDTYDISFEGMHARQLQKEDANDFQYIIVMDDSNKANALEICAPLPSENIVLLTDYVKERSDTYVPDPYFTGDFDYTYELVLEGCKNLLEHIQQEQNLS